MYNKLTCINTFIISSCFNLSVIGQLVTYPHVRLSFRRALSSQGVEFLHISAALILQVLLYLGIPSVATENIHIKTRHKPSTIFLLISRHKILTRSDSVFECTEIDSP